jgi:hypothetical protein
VATPPRSPIACRASALRERARAVGEQVRAERGVEMAAARIERALTT